MLGRLSGLDVCSPDRLGLAKSADMLRWRRLDYDCAGEVDRLRLLCAAVQLPGAADVPRRLYADFPAVVERLELGRVGLYPDCSAYSICKLNGYL